MALHLAIDDDACGVDEDKAGAKFSAAADDAVAENAVQFVEEHFQGKFLDKEFMEKVFNDHNEAVKNYVPANKLLVFDVCEGWEPLCKFLDVEVPCESLPHTNKKEDFHIMVAELMQGNLV